MPQHRLANATRLLAPTFGLLALGLGAWLRAPTQEPASDQEQGRAHPLTAFREGEQARVEREIEGAWLLTSFQTSEEVFDERDYAGFALFADGFLSLIWYASEDVVGFLRGVETLHTVQAQVFRYRITSRGTLQAAGMLGFSNVNDEHELYLDGGSTDSEYRVTLLEGELRLFHPDGRRFHFRRVESGEFPERSAKALQGRRGALPFDDE